MRDGKQDRKLNDPYHVTNPLTERKQVVRARDAGTRDDREVIKRLQDIKRCNESDLLKMAHQVDVLSAALERIVALGGDNPKDPVEIAKEALKCI